MLLDLSDRKKLLKTYFSVHSSAQKSNQFFFNLKVLYPVDISLINLS